MARGAKRAEAEAGPVEEPWELPDGWRWERLGAIATTKGGGALKLNKSHYRESGVPAFSASGQDGYVDVAEFNHDAVILSSIGARCGKCFLATGEWTSLANTQIIFPNEPGWSKYLWLYLNDERRWPRSGSAQPFIRPSDMRNVPVPVPPPGVRDVIVRLVEDLFGEVSDGDRALKEVGDDLETYRKSLLKAAYDGTLTAEWRASNPPTQTGPELLEKLLAARRATWTDVFGNQGKKYADPQGPDLSGLPELPQGWCWASLQQIAFVSGGVAVDAKRKPVDPVEVPYLRVANVQRGRLDLSVLKTITMSPPELAKYRLQPGDILLNEGGDRDKVGRGWVWAGAVDPCVHQNHVFKARPASDLIEPELVSSYLNELGRRFFLDESKQTTNLASISLTKVSRAPVPIPPAAEALAIRRALSEAEQGVTAVASLGALGMASTFLRQSILAAAFRGDLVA